jgi:hypothetical protein
MMQPRASKMKQVQSDFTGAVRLLTLKFAIPDPESVASSLPRAPRIAVFGSLLVIAESELCSDDIRYSDCWRYPILRF